MNINISYHIPVESGAQQAIVPPKLIKNRVGQRSVRKCVGVSNPLYVVYDKILDLGCTTPQITVDYESIPMWWPTLCSMWLGGALIQVSAL